MLRSAALLCVFAASAFGAYEGEVSLRVTYGSDPDEVGINTFMLMPTTVDEAKNRGWVPVKAPEGNLCSQETVYVRPKDFGYGIFFDANGNYTGTNIGLYQDSYRGVFNDAQMKAQGHTEWAVEVDGVIQKLWAIQACWVKSELSNPADDGTFYEGKAVLVSYNGRPMIIASDRSKLSGDWEIQGCLEWQGQLYMFQMTKTTEFNPETLLPWIPMFSGDLMVGLAYYNFGKYDIFSDSDHRTNYVEQTKPDEVEVGIPERPEWFDDLVKNDGIKALTTFFILYPTQVTCN